VPTSKGKEGREGGRGAGEEGWGVKAEEGKGGKYHHFFLYTVSTGYS